MDLSKGGGCIPTGIVCPGDGVCRYISTRSSVMIVMATLEGGGWRSMLPLYHPLIQIHASHIRCGSDVMSDSTADPALAAL